MNRMLIACLAALLFTAPVVAQGQLPLQAPKTDKEKMSYALGATIGKNVAEDAADLNLEQMLQGMRDAISGGKIAMTDDEIRTAMQAFQKAMIAAQQAKLKAEAEKNKAAGEKYLAENREKKGVKVTDSGLQYEVLVAGNGATPKKTDIVKTHYHGTLVDGTVFDSSVERKQPATFPVGRVIKGWTEALQLMKVGDKWRLVIPSDLAYGSEALPGSPIPPNSVLIFEVELLGIEE